MLIWETTRETSWEPSLIRNAANAPDHRESERENAARKQLRSKPRAATDQVPPQQPALPGGLYPKPVPSHCTRNEQLNRVRRVVPVVAGGLDLSPLVVWIAIVFLQRFLVQTLYDLARSLHYG